MRKLFPLLAFTFLLVACEDIKGNLNVNEELSLKAKKTGLFQSGTKDVKVPAGSYEAKLSPSSKTSMNLELKVNGKEIKVPFKVREGTKIPEYDGVLDILAQDSGQPYDLHADVKSDVSSYDFDTTETCVAGYIPVRRCITHPGTTHCTSMPSGEVCRTGRRGERVCTQQPATRHCTTRPAYTDCRMIDEAVYGSQNVAKRRTTTVKNLVVDVLAAGRIVAQFNHQNTSSYTSTIGSSMCYR